MVGSRRGTARSNTERTPYPAFPAQLPPLDDCLSMRLRGYMPVRYAFVPGGEVYGLG